MVTKIRLGCDPPVRGNAADRALPRRTDTEGQLRVVRQWSIAAEIQIEQIVQEAIATETDHLLRVYLLDKCFGGRHRRQLRAYIRKAPCGDRVPDILDGRVVVGGDAPEQRVAVDVEQLREPYVRIVPAEVMGDAVPGSLDESSRILGEGA